VSRRYWFAEQEVIYDLLFLASAETLLEVARDPACHAFPEGIRCDYRPFS